MLRSTRKHLYAHPLYLALLLATACQASVGNGGHGEDGALGTFSSGAAGATGPRLAERQFDLLTPGGLKLFQASITWMADHENHPGFARPATCAKNMSRVLEMAGYKDYSTLLVPTMVAKVRAGGGKIVSLPRDRAGIIAALNNLYGGRIPAGTLIAGCLNKDCSGKSGDGHVAMVGDIDSGGNILAYHNNWYRPDNAGGVWKEHMVSRRYYYDLGRKRQWMSTPWLRLKRDSKGKIIDLASSLPAVDDLDPMQYHVTLAIPPDIAAGAGQAIATRPAFWDVAGHWAAGFINRLAARKLIVGFQDGTYRPHVPVTRAETAVLLAVGLDLARAPTASGRGGGCPFTDVAKTHWGRWTVCHVYRAGYMAGTSASGFSPDRVVTREQFLATLAAGLKLSAAMERELTRRFDDADRVASWARGKLAATARDGLVVSYPNTRKLEPSAACTGGEAAAFLHQALVHRGALPPFASPYIVR